MDDNNRDLNLWIKGLLKFCDSTLAPADAGEAEKELCDLRDRAQLM